MSEFKPFETGDIVEHTSYPGVLFEISECFPQVFSNRRTYALKVFGTLRPLANTVARPLRHNLEENDGVVFGSNRNVRHPSNEMEVLAVAWAGRISE